MSNIRLKETYSSYRNELSSTSSSPREEASQFNEATRGMANAFFTLITEQKKEIASFLF
jgi:hypothetical protein